MFPERGFDHNSLLVLLVLLATSESGASNMCCMMRVMFTVCVQHVHYTAYHPAQERQRHVRVVVRSQLVRAQCHVGGARWRRDPHGEVLRGLSPGCLA